MTIKAYWRRKILQKYAYFLQKKHTREGKCAKSMPNMLEKGILEKRNVLKVCLACLKKAY